MLFIQWQTLISYFYQSIKESHAPFPCASFNHLHVDPWRNDDNTKVDYIEVNNYNNLVQFYSYLDFDQQLVEYFSPFFTCLLL